MAEENQVFKSLHSWQWAIKFLILFNLSEGTSEINHSADVLWKPYSNLVIVSINVKNEQYSV